MLQSFTRAFYHFPAAAFAVGGNPMAGAAVEACQGSGAAAAVLDSSVTDDAGQYRIGNLRPGAAYELRVRFDGRVVSAHPASQQVRCCAVTQMLFACYQHLSVSPTLLRTSPAAH